MVQFLLSLLASTVAWCGICVAGNISELFLHSLQEDELLSYFGTKTIAESDIDIINLTCSCDNLEMLWSCSVKTCTLKQNEETYKFRFIDAQRPVTTERVLNSTAHSLKNFPEGCGAPGIILHPARASSIISYCEGELRGFVIVAGEQLFIQPVKKNHLMSLKENKLSNPHLLYRAGFSLSANIVSSPTPDFHSIKKRSPADVKHLELLVVVGHDVFQIHQEDTERYILTNLNIGSELLRDVSLGAAFRVHLVKMIILTEPEADIKISPDINSFLVSVCKWSKTVNPPGDEDPYHADLVLYVTRFDLTNGERTLRGVTQLGGACTSSWSCVITKDTGFDLGITIAHEIGHSFGINHDGTENHCSGDGNIMAMQESHNSVHLTWSECSREQFLRFLGSGQANCVNDLPALESSIPGWKPGHYYGADEQCQIAFGSSAIACTFSRNDLDTCSVLSCHTSQQDRKNCKRILVPLLDGTECGDNKWCHKGLCSSLEELNPVAVVHGAWSSWTSFSSCSRSCGGGVVTRKRLCNNPRPAFGGHTCEGPSLQADMCNTQACETSQLDFMNQQCSATDTEPLYLTPGIPTFYKWTAAAGFANGDSLCQHLCRAHGKNFMVGRRDRFIDGTRCEPSDESNAPFSLCIAGSCKAFSCDGVMDSTMGFDQCGVCGGDNSTCKRVSGSFSEGRAGVYSTFLTVPIASIGITVTNQKPLFTHLAVKENGTYIVAGKGKISINVTVPSVLEDRRIEYRLKLTNNMLPHLEQIHIDGPTEGDIEIQVYRKYGQEYGEVTNPDISYSYYVPRKEETYVWSAVRGPCSASCGGGFQVVTYVCMDQMIQQQTQSAFCSDSILPTTLHENCGNEPCPPRWVIEDTSPCSVSCGGGVMLLNVYCASNQRGNETILPDSHCGHLARPKAFSTCGQVPCPARWEMSEPGLCSAVCGYGVALRNVSCVQSQAGWDVLVDDSLCSAQEKPPSVVQCVVSVCPVGWETLPISPLGMQLMEPLLSENSSLLNSPSGKKIEVFVWSPVLGECSVTCGSGMAELHYICIEFYTREEALEENCNQSLKPKHRQNICNPQSCPPGWEVRERTPCPVTCGGGTIQLEVFCARKENGILRRLPHAKCSPIQRPNGTKTCGTLPCPVRWHYKSGSCSVSCGGGILLRLLYCVREVTGGDSKEQIVGDAECQHLPHPQGQEPCNQNPCPPRWKVTETGQCSSACGYGISKQHVACVQTVSRAEIEVNITACSPQEKPPSIIPCFVTNCIYLWESGEWSQCSATCGNGIQTRHSLCVNRKTGQQVSPTFCGHTAKPLTMRGCSGHSCQEDSLMPGTPVPPTDVPVVEASDTPYMSTQHKVTAIPPDNLPAVRSRGMEEQYTDSSICGQLFLNSSGILSTVGLVGSSCMFSIGRPLGEVIFVKVLASSLNCSAGDMLLFHGRTMWQKKCNRLAGVTINSRSNILTVRQRQTHPGNGVELEYWSERAKQNQSRDCDVQLYGMHGIIQNPVQSWQDGWTPACRIFIDVPPQYNIFIHALYMNLETGSNETHSNYILIRDLKTSTAFHGNHMFLWSSSGSQAEIEFHGEFSKEVVSFQAEYWAQNQRQRSRRRATHG
ncbi:A disintegrin and metalloproteinase with thrombospondin motifs 13 isoform X1 [Pelobates fuscus]|uniref:A disintegrin and metalloproteinase with thrombospondin motifs 13 isoform X1 n=2 Tax=Pelobates fuscus TaxID=191477 RepID=UPI002FE4BAF1